MATRRLINNAANKIQVSTITVGGTWLAGEIVTLTIGSIVQQPGEDGALLAERIAAKVYQRLGSRMQGRGF